MSEEIRCCPECGYPGWNKRNVCNFCGLRRTRWTGLVGRIRDLLDLKHFRGNAEETRSVDPQRAAKIMAAAGVIAVSAGLYWFFMSPTWNSADPAELAKVQPIRDPEANAMARWPARADMDRAPLEAEVDNEASPTPSEANGTAAHLENADSNPNFDLDPPGISSQENADTSDPTNTELIAEAGRNTESGSDSVQTGKSPSFLDQSPAAESDSSPGLPTQDDNPPLADVGVTPNQLPNLPIPETKETDTTTPVVPVPEPANTSASSQVADDSDDPTSGRETAGPVSGQSVKSPKSPNSTGSTTTANSPNESTTGDGQPSPSQAQPGQPPKLDLSRAFRGHQLILEPIVP